MIASPIALPRAPRLTWFAQKLREQAGLLTFGSLLRDLAPEKYAALRDKSTIGCYLELINHLETLFPIDMFMAEQIVEGYMDEGQDSYSLSSAGIPVEVQGVDLDDYGPEDIGSSALAVCLCFGVEGETWSNTTPYSEFPILADFADDLPQPCDVLPKLIRPPRGRAWIEPWNALRDLFCYAKGITGYAVLDYPRSLIYEGNVMNPPWNLGEIRSLAHEWEQADPILERAHLLTEHIEAQPYVRLPLLARALSRDRDALREITYQVRGKTLCDVFAREP